MTGVQTCALPIYRVEEVELLGDERSTYNADDIVNRKEQEMIIADKINKLPKKQADALMLRLFFGLSYKQIARLMRCSFNTALSYVYYAKKKLNNN